MLTQAECLRFESVLRDVATSNHDTAGIGTYKEKSLHYILKNYFCSDKACHECSYKGYVADIMEDGYITEIQSSSFYGMSQKLNTFLKDAHVRIIFPIIAKKTIVWVDPDTGALTRSARAVKRDDIYSLVCQFVYILEFLLNEKLSITAVTLSADDYRLLNGYGNDRKKRAEKLDLVPTEIIAVEDIVLPTFLTRCVPETLGEVFTREEFSRATHLRARKLWAVLRVLTELQIIKREPDDGRRHRYSRNVTYYT